MNNLIKQSTKIKIMRHLMIVILLSICALSGYTQTRVDRPIRFQLNFSGAFLKAFEQSLSTAEVESFDVENWLVPGIDIGYQIN